MIGLIAATANGRRNAAHLAGSGPTPTSTTAKPRRPSAGPGTSATGSCSSSPPAPPSASSLPCSRSKHRDPGVVTVDDAANFAVALCGGHGGGANALAASVADTLGATPVVTTASDSVGFPALDSSRRETSASSWRKAPTSRRSGPRSSRGRRSTSSPRRRWPLGPLPENVVQDGEREPPVILVSDRLEEVPRPAVVYRPPSLVAGVGCSRGGRQDEILGLLDSVPGGGRTLREERRCPRQHRREARRSWDCSRRQGSWTCRSGSSRLKISPRSRCPTRPSRSRGGRDAERRGGGRGLLRRGTDSRRSGSPANATVAMGRLPVRGRLALVEPGAGRRRPDPTARPRGPRRLGAGRRAGPVRRSHQAPAAAGDAGSHTAARKRDGAGEAGALAEARAGGSVALVSSGDVGVYAMASPALELAGDDVDVVVVPGVTAAQAAASLLGSPLGHDHCSISLSDLLTPWEVIQERVQSRRRRRTSSSRSTTRARRAATGSSGR